jgi:hypothetical protein
MKNYRVISIVPGTSYNADTKKVTEDSSYFNVTLADSSLKQIKATASAKQFEFLYMQAVKPGAVLGFELTHHKAGDAIVDKEGNPVLAKDGTPRTFVADGASITNATVVDTRVFVAEENEYLRQSTMDIRRATAMESVNFINNSASNDKDRDILIALLKG